MRAAPLPNESERLDALHRLTILDTDHETHFDDITAFAAKMCDVPVALISFVDADRQWFKSTCGFGANETDLESSICAHTILEDTFLEIENTTLDPRTADNPVVTGEENVRFYAGAILRDSEGFALGSLCVLDRRPRKLTELQRETLMFLARQVMAQAELRRSLDQETALRGEIDHRVKNSLQTVASILRVQRAGLQSTEAKEAMMAAERRIKTISLLHNELYSTENYQALELAGFVQRLCTLLRGTLPPGIRLASEIEEIEVASGKAKAIAMIVGEFIANSSKHAFDEGQSGEVRVLGRGFGGGYELTIYDNGRGISGEPLREGGLGQKIISASVDQLGGEAAYGLPPLGGTGTCLRISFRPDPAAAPDD